MKNKKKIPKYMQDRVRTGTLFLVPATIMVFLMMLIPQLFVVALSFVKWNGSRSQSMKFVGLQNYLKLGHMQGVPDMVKFTFIFAISVTLLTVLISMLVAFALDKPVGHKGVNRSFLRSCWYIPTLIGSVAIGIIWRIMYNYHSGLFNALLGVFGIAPVNWLEDYGVSALGVIIAQVWVNLGVNIVVFLAGLQSVPVDLYESATIDGASNLQQRLHITIPMIMPTITVALITTSIGAFKAYELPYTITKGMPGYSTRMVSQMIQEYSISGLQYGPGAALSVLLTVLILVIQLIQLFALRKKEESYE